MHIYLSPSLSLYIYTNLSLYTYIIIYIYIYIQSYHNTCNSYGETREKTAGEEEL